MRWRSARPLGKSASPHREGALDEGDRVLATVLFTDIADSTRLAAETGGKEWRKLLDSPDELASQMVLKHRGTLIKSTGDGILATFDGHRRGWQDADQCAGCAVLHIPSG